MKWHTASLPYDKVRFINEQNCVVNLENESFFVPRKLVSLGFERNEKRIFVRFTEDFKVTTLKTKSLLNLFELLLREKKMNIS